MKPARLRFAPSPTGIPHIGNLYSAVLGWALARSLGGDFIIRIEDTDRERNTPEATAQMLAALDWLTVDWDEGPDIGGEAGPYIQSQRLPRHQEVMAELVANDRAYYGDDPDHPAEPAGNPLRLRLPREGEIVLQDAIRGPIRFDNAQRKVDPIVARSDGRPLYHLAAMTDDHDMGITHVVRGEEWISSSPIHIHLYQVMGWELPVWVHVPLILNKRGEKLSKRDPEGGYLISDFQQAGYLPEAVFNYLLLLGWTPDDEQEILTKWEVRQLFRIERLSASASVFDWDKLNWVQRQYLQRQSDAQLAKLVAPFLADVYGPLPANEAWLVKLTATIRDEIVRLTDVVDQAEWAFSPSFVTDEEAGAVLAGEFARPVLTRLVAEMAHVVLLDTETANTILKGMRNQFKQEQGWGPRQIYQPIRAALIGKVHGPPLAEIMGLLGKESCMGRIATALKY